MRYILLIEIVMVAITFIVGCLYNGYWVAKPTGPQITHTAFFASGRLIYSICGAGNIMGVRDGPITKVTTWDDGNERTEANPLWLTSTAGCPVYTN